MQASSAFRNVQSDSHSTDDVSDLLAGFENPMVGISHFAPVKQNANLSHEQTVPFLDPKQTGYAGE